MKWFRDRDACFLILGNLQMLPTRKCVSKTLEETNLFPPEILLEAAFHLLALTLLSVLYLGFFLTSPRTSTPPSRGASIFGRLPHVLPPCHFKKDSCAFLSTL